MSTSSDILSNDLPRSRPQRVLELRGGPPDRNHENGSGDDSTVRAEEGWTAAQQSETSQEDDDDDYDDQSWCLVTDSDLNFGSQVRITVLSE
jgi:hypothetical protein